MTIAAMMLALTWLQAPSRNIRDAGNWVQDLATALEFIGIFFWWCVVVGKGYYILPKTWDFVVKKMEVDRDGDPRPADGRWPQELPWLFGLGLVVTMNTYSWLNQANQDEFADGKIRTIYGDVQSTSRWGIVCTSRAFYLMYTSCSTRTLFYALFKMVFKISSVMIVAAMSFLVHYLMLRAAGDDTNGWGNNGDIAEQMWQLFVLFTTANHPDAVMTLYHEKGWTGFILLSYMSFNLLIILNVLLAILTDGYADITAASHEYDAKLRYGARSQAFALVKTTKGQADEISLISAKYFLSSIANFSFRHASSLTAPAKLDKATQEYYNDAEDSPDTIWMNVVYAIANRTTSCNNGVSRAEWHRLMTFAQVPLKIKSVLDPAVRYNIWEKYYKKRIKHRSNNEISLLEQPEFPAKLQSLQSCSSPAEWASRLPRLHYFMTSWAYPPVRHTRHGKATLGHARHITYDLLCGILLISLVTWQLGTDMSHTVDIVAASVITADMILQFLIHSQHSEWKPPEDFKRGVAGEPRSPIRLPRVMWTEFFGQPRAFSGSFSIRFITIVCDILSLIFGWSTVICNATVNHDWTNSGDSPPFCGDADGNLSAITCLAMGFRLCSATMRLPGPNIIFHKIIHALVLSGPMILLFISAYTFYAGIGMSLFAGRLTQIVEDGGPGDWSTAPWNSTSFASGEVEGGNYYYDLSFDNFGKSFILLFTQMIQNNWFWPVEGHRIVTGTKLVRVFFISFNIFVSIILINIFTGHILTVFNEIFSDEKKKINEEFRPMAELFHHVEYCLRYTVSMDSDEPYSRFWEVDEEAGLFDNPGQLLEDEKLMLPCELSLSKEPGNTGFHHLLNTVQIPLFLRNKVGTIMYVSIPFQNILNSEMNNLIAETTGNLFPGLEDTFIKCHEEAHPDNDSADNDEHNGASSNDVELASTKRTLSVVPFKGVIDCPHAKRKESEGSLRNSAIDGDNVLNGKIVTMGSPEQKWRLYFHAHGEDVTMFWLTPNDNQTQIEVPTNPGGSWPYRRASDAKVHEKRRSKALFGKGAPHELHNPIADEKPTPKPHVPSDENVQIRTIDDKTDKGIIAV